MNELQRGKQGLRFFDFRKFRSRRKAFERRREHGVSVGGTVSRLIKLRQRQRRLELERARTLFVSDAQSFAVRGFGGRGVTFCQNVAAHAVKL